MDHLGLQTSVDRQKKIYKRLHNLGECISLGFICPKHFEAANESMWEMFYNYCMCGFL